MRNRCITQRCGLLILFLVLFITGCGKNESKKIEETKQLIQKIYLDSVNPLPEIRAAEAKFLELSPESQEIIKDEEFEYALDHIEMYVVIDIIEQLDTQQTTERNSDQSKTIKEAQSAYYKLSEDEQKEIARRYREGKLSQALLKIEDKEIRDAISCEQIGYGNKLAIFDEITGLYSYSGDYLPSELRATSPDEICGFVKYDYIYGSLRYSEGKVLYAANDHNGESIEFDEESAFPYGLGQCVIEIRAVLFTEALNEQGDITFPGNGTKYIIFNENTDSYEACNDFVFTSITRPLADLYANSVEDVGYILSYLVTKYDDSAMYSGLGWVKVTCERMRIRLINAVTGEVLEEETIETKPPDHIYSSGEFSENYHRTNSLEFSTIVNTWWKILNKHVS